MPLHNASRDRYGALSQLFHWLTAITVLVAFIYGLGGSEQDVYSRANDFQRQLHESLGMFVLSLTALRLVWRIVATRPDKDSAPRWMGVAAQVVQASLYVLLFAIPLTAIAGAWLEGHPLTLLAGVEIAPWWGPSHGVGAWIADLHTWLGLAIMWLAGLHALAALLHHFVLRDNVLLSMLPGRFARRRAEH